MQKELSDSAQATADAFSFCMIDSRAARNLDYIYTCLYIMDTHRYFGLQYMKYNLIGE